MDLTRHFEPLDRPQAIEVVHLLNRYLSHKLDEAAFRKLFVADRSSIDASQSQQAYRLAVHIVRDLEREENAELSEFSSGAIQQYLLQINEVTEGSAFASADRSLVGLAKLELQSFRTP